MSTQAVIKIAGHQYLVKKGDQITVDNQSYKEGQSFDTDKVLLIVDDKQKVTLGSPTIKGASVSLKVITFQKGLKINVLRFRAKSRYRRRIGHRQPQTILEVQKIDFK